MDLESVELVDLNQPALMDSLPHRFVLTVGDQELVPMDLSRALAPLRGEAEGEEATGGVGGEVGGLALTGRNRLALTGRPRGNLAVMEAKPGPARMGLRPQSAQERM